MIEIRKRPYQFNFSGNSVYYELFSQAAADNPAIDFQIMVQFKRADAANFTPVTETPLTFTPVNGAALINISDLVDSMLEYEVPILQQDENAAFISAKQSGSFYIHFREVTPDQAVPGFALTEQSYIRQAIKGGIAFYQFKGNNFFTNYWPQQRPFLTWQLSGRLAALNERMYLAWFHDSDTAIAIRARVTVVYADETTAEVLVPVPAAYLKILYIPSGATQLGLPLLHPDKKIWYWEIQLERILPGDASGALTQKFRYEADNRNDYNQVTLHYRNSLGGFDSLRVRGEIEETAEYQLTETQKIVGGYYFADSVLPAENTIADNVEQITYKGHIPHLTKEEQDRLRDALMIREAWWLKHNRWWPVKLTIKSFRLRGTKDKRWGIPIEWQIANEGERYYTPESITMGEGVFSDNICGATISDIVATKEDIGVGLFAITHSFTVNTPEGGNTNLVRWWIPGFVDQKQDHWLFNGPEITVNLPPGVYQFQLQPVCNNQQEGQVYTNWFTTAEGEEPAIPDHYIKNESGVTTSVYVRNGLRLGLGGGGILFSAEIAAGGILPLAAAMIGIDWNYALVSFDNLSPASGEVISGEETFTGSIAYLINLGGGGGASTPYLRIPINKVLDEPMKIIFR